MNFEDCFQYVFARETRKDDPDHVNEDPNDMGGITKYGISLRFLKNVPADELKVIGIFGEVDAETIKNLSLPQAKSLYKTQFWDKAPFEKIGNKIICQYVFDMAFNFGISPAIKCAQRAVWAVMQQKMILIDDGIMGQETIDLINKTCLFLLPALRSERASHYRLIVEKHPDQQKNLAGWLNRAYGK